MGIYAASGVDNMGVEKFNHLSNEVIHSPSLVAFMRSAQIARV